MSILARKLEHACRQCQRQMVADPAMPCEACRDRQLRLNASRAAEVERNHGGRQLIGGHTDFRKPQAKQNKGGVA